MTPRSTDQRLDDIVTAIDVIRDHEAELDAAGIGRDRRVRLDAVVRQLAIIAEAAAHLPDDLTAQEPQIAWRDVIAMRLVFDHRYHVVDPAIVWRTVDEGLPALRRTAHRLRDRTG